MIHCTGYDMEEHRRRTGANRVTRRTLLSGLGALTAGGLIASRAGAQSEERGIIDIHHHFVSPAFLKALSEKEGRKVPGFTSFFPLGLWKNYSPAKDIEVMDRDGVAAAMLSITAPGTWFGDHGETLRLTRELNEFAAKLVSDHKGRYGLFAVLPLPLVDETLKEIEYAFDTLKADGVGMLTSYGNKWLGDAAFQPVLDELNRRKAVVYTHPIDAPCCQDLQPGVNPTTLEYPTDTTRTILSLVMSNAAARYSDIRFVFSHAGGTLPSVIGRIGIAPPDVLSGVLAKPAEPGSRLSHLRRFYYDTAMSTNAPQMQGLKAIVGASQIVFGTDYPFGADAAKHMQGLRTCGLSAEELRAITRDNTLSIVPRLRA
jgi:predicted TIM-barrel fold metal-dependent hydrolase